MSDVRMWESRLQDDVARKWVDYQAAQSILDRFKIAQHRGGPFLEEMISSLEGMPQLNTMLGDLNIPTRIVNALVEGGFLTVRQVLADKNAGELLKVRNFGPSALRSLANSLEENGYPVPLGWKRHFPKG